MKNLTYAIIAALFISGCAKEPESEQPVVDPEAGRAIVEAECSGCHGMDGGGKRANIPNLAAQPADYLAEAMYAYRDDRRHHAALKDLIAGFAEADIRNIAAYFASLPPVHATGRQPADSAVVRFFGQHPQWHHQYGCQHPVDVDTWRKSRAFCQWVAFFLWIRCVPGSNDFRTGSQPGGDLSIRLLGLGRTRCAYWLIRIVPARQSRTPSSACR